jgi:AP-2 complex subunit alpha
MFDLLQTPSLHENMVKISAYVLSEFGHLIAADSPAKSVEKQYELIHKHFYNVSQSARGLILTAYMKMLRTTKSLKKQIVPILKQYKDFWDEDIQQRVCEYLAMIEIAEADPS